MDLRVSYAHGYRAPALRELFFSFHNASHNIDGNPDLEAESSNNFSASYTWRILHNGNVRLTSSLTGFYNDFKDRITTATDKNNSTHTTYYNSDKYRTTGGTFENNVVWGNLNANVSFTLVGRYNQYASKTEYVDKDMSDFRFSPELSANVAYTFKTATSVSLFYKFTGARKEYYYDSDSKDVYLKGSGSYHWGDLTVSQKVWKYINVNAGIKNLFDVTTVENSISGGHGTSGGGSRFVGCGRSYFLGLTFQFNNNYIK